MLSSKRSAMSKRCVEDILYNESFKNKKCEKILEQTSLFRYSESSDFSLQNTFTNDNSVEFIIINSIGDILVMCFSPNYGRSSSLLTLVTILNCVCLFCPLPNIFALFIYNFHSFFYKFLTHLDLFCQFLKDFVVVGCWRIIQQCWSVFESLSPLCLD